MKSYMIFPYVFLLPLLLSSCSSDEENAPEVIAEEKEEEEEEFSSEIFFSEYVEGNSHNKALEIVNLTGESVNFDEAKYSIKKQINGSGDWMGEVILNGNLKHSDVFVIAHESADIPEITENAHQLKTGAPMDFNGNDPVGLFKDDELIDVIGTADDSGDFAKDETLRRKKTVTEPSTTFYPESWENFETDTTEDLGKY